MSFMRYGASSYKAEAGREILIVATSKPEELAVKVLEGSTLRVILMIYAESFDTSRESKFAVISML